MKKQILILVLATFAIGFLNKAYAQTPLTPRTITCLTLSADALHPVPGQDYDYTIEVPNIATFTDPMHYRWFVTQDPNFITIVGGVPTVTNNIALDGSYFDVDDLAGSGYNLINPPLAGEPNINITWRSAGYDRTRPIFLAIMVIGDDGTCTPNNLKVYKIEPQFAFTLDLANLDGTGALQSDYGYTDLENCISDIQSAVYDPTAPEGILYDFGSNTLYYEVSAANWYDRWQLRVEITGLFTGTDDQTVQIDWAYPVRFGSTVSPPLIPGTVDYANISDWNVVAAAGSVEDDGPFTATELVAPQGATAFVDADGESIIIRVIVTHGNEWEGITDQQLTLAVDGVLAPEDPDNAGSYVPGTPGAIGYGDIHYEADPDAVPPATGCPWYDIFVNDYALQTIKARPEIESATPAVPGPDDSPFLPIKP
jgi:hypothetical protein